MAITAEQIDHWFTHHPPQNAEQLQAYKEIREAGAVLAHTINHHAPESADKSAAIRKVREATMTANAAIACGGK